ncbi:MAG: hypothetical protein ACOC1K_05695, partial [Nanoarchaeota archaeon]
MKKVIILIIGLILISTSAFAYNPNSFYDEETVNVHGNRPKVDIVVSELDVTILETDFIDGVATKRVEISNDGNVPCRIELELQNVPIDLNVNATVDSEFLLKGEITTLNIEVELSEQQNEETFDFTILVKANLRP